MVPSVTSLVFSTRQLLGYIRVLVWAIICPRAVLAVTACSRESVGRVQATHHTEAGSETEIHKLIQTIVDCPFEGLNTMAERGSFDAACHCSEVAPISLSQVLAMEVAL